jgi:hypothetical protein
LANEQASEVLDKYTQTDEKGNKMLLGISDSDDRRKVQTAVRNYMTNGYEIKDDKGNGTGKFVPLTADMMDDALGSLRDYDWVDTTDDIEKVVNKFMEENPAYLQQYVRKKDYDNRVAEIRSGSFKALVKGKPQPVQRDVPVTAIDNAAAEVSRNQQVEPQPVQVTPEQVPEPEAVEPVTQRPAPRNLMERPVSGLVMDGFNALVDGANTIRDQSVQSRIQGIEHIASGKSKLSTRDMKRFLERGIPKEGIKPETLNQLRKILGVNYVNSLLE